MQLVDVFVEMVDQRFLRQMRLDGFDPGIRREELVEHAPQVRQEENAQKHRPAKNPSQPRCAVPRPSSGVHPVLLKERFRPDSRCVSSLANDE
jgi:hypothetical protein